MRIYFMTTERIGFSKWQKNDLDLAKLLWGDPEVTHFICVSGSFTEQDIIKRLDAEIRNDTLYQIQYWPIFKLSTSELIGCCGLRPCGDEPNIYEIGFHLRKRFWRKGLAAEAARAVLCHAFSTLEVAGLLAGHHPQNVVSQALLIRLGFQYVQDCYYAPTGRNHPSYRLTKEAYKAYTA